MNRNQKEVLVAELHNQLAQAEAAFLVNYQGLSVADLQKLRTGLRGEGAVMQVAKARLMIHAAKQIEGFGEFIPFLKNQVGLVFAKTNAPAVAKAIVEFSKEQQSLSVVSGFFENRVWSKGEVEYLAAIPSREVLLAQLAQVLQAPIAGLARALDLVAKKDGESAAG